MKTDNIKILLIEDDSVDAELVKRALRRNGSSPALHWEPTLSAAVDILHAEKFDIVLSDLSLPDGSGHETIARVRCAAPGTPIVVLTDLDNEAVETELLNAGAEDYIVKGEMTAAGLARTIRHARQRHAGRVRIRELLAEVETKNVLLSRKNEKLAKLYAQAHQFVDNVSHEFRTPLTVVKEYISLVREGLAGEVNQEQTRLLTVAEDRADDLNTMVDDMLDVSKLEAGMLGAWRKTCAFADVTKYVTESLQRKADVKKVQLTWDLDDDLPSVYCDAEKASRVITNLAVNAIKFCGDPGIVSIRAHADHDAREIRVSIQDNGPGIDEESLASIFQRFRQLNQSIRSSTKGFGLGLNIARELTDVNFGRIDVASEVKKGSVFSFTLPFAEPLEVVSRYLNRIERVLGEGDDPCNVSIVEASIPDEIDQRINDDSEAFLNYCLRANDLLFRVDKNRWIIVLPDPAAEVQTYFERIDTERESVNRNRPFGPLPKLEMDRAGSWCIKTQGHEDVLSCVGECVQSRAPIACLA